jgi:multidrug efflux pump subunit AcrA (membrane-fusion protein)
MNATTKSESIEVRAVAAELAAYIEAKPEFRPGLSVAEIFELNYRYFREFQNSDARKSSLESARAAKRAEAAAKKAEREAARKARLVEERAKLEAKLAALAGSDDDSPESE